MRNFIFLAIVIVVLIAAATIIGGRRSRSPASISVGTPEPAVAMLNLTDYRGETVAMRSLLVKPLVINAWASWCPFCVEELKDFAAVQAELKGRVTIIAVNRGESQTVAKSFTDQLGLTDRLVFLLDRGDSFYQTIGGFSMPETVFVATSGVIVYHKRGPMRADEIRERIEQLIISHDQIR